MRQFLVVVLLALLLVACGSNPSGGGDEVPPSLQGSVGTLNTGTDSLSTSLTVLASVPGESGTIEVSVGGPEGWNGGEPAVLSVEPNGVSEHGLSVVPVDGEFELSMVVGGVTYRAAASLDASRSLAPVSNIVITEATASRVRVAWDEVEGAASYEVRLERVDSGEVVQTVTVTVTSATFELTRAAGLADLRTAQAGEYRVSVTAKSGSGSSGDGEFAGQADRSVGTSESFTVPDADESKVVQGLVGTYNMKGNASLNMNLAIYTAELANHDVLDVTVTGPAGWNGGEPFVRQQDTGLLYNKPVAIAPVDGEYTFSVVVDGVTHTDRARLDTDQVLASAGDVTVEEAAATRVRASWEAVAGADFYTVYVENVGTNSAQGFGDVDAPNAILTDLDLLEGEDYRLVVRATTAVSGGDGVPLTGRADVSLTDSDVFTIAPVSGTTVTVDLPTGHAEDVQLVAYQDGSSAWARADVSGGTYSFDVTDPDGRYGVALICGGHSAAWGTRTYPLIGHATTRDATTWTLPCLNAPGPSGGAGTASISGAVSGFAGDTTYVRVATANQQQEREAYATSLPYDLIELEDGVYDVVATTSVDPFGMDLESIMIAHDVAVSGATTLDLDFAQGVALEQHDLTIGGLVAEETPSYHVALMTENGTQVTLNSSFQEGVPSSYSVPIEAAPVSVMAVDDVHVLSASAYETVGDVMHTRSLTRFLRQASDLTLTLPPGRLEPTVSAVAGAPYLRYSVSWNDVGGEFVTLSFDVDVAPSGNMFWPVFITNDWLADESYTLPDLTAVEGWDPAWTPPAGDVDTTYWGVGAHFDGVQESLGRAYGDGPAEGDEESFVEASGTLF